MPNYFWVRRSHGVAILTDRTRPHFTVKKIANIPNTVKQEIFVSGLEEIPAPKIRESSCCEPPDLAISRNFHVANISCPTVLKTL